MKTRQAQALAHTLAYSDEEPYGGLFRPSQRAVGWFFAYSDRGFRPPWSQTKDYADFCRLLQAHHFASGAQKTMWLEEMQLRLGLCDYLRDGIGDIERWRYRLPAYGDLYNLSIKAHEGVQDGTLEFSIRDGGWGNWGVIQGGAVGGCLEGGVSGDREVGTGARVGEDTA